ncbi:hypothetical protein SNE40_000963 [Patella caerulea]|uniref:Uncharacterized protein n=1 Tax=Patella caerulea TaxID=87958 RepID=A0AAN8K666_PATCE
MERNGRHTRLFSMTVFVILRSLALPVAIATSDPSYIYIVPASNSVSSYETNDDDSPSKSYRFAFEEANASYIDFESQTVYIYELACRRSCTKRLDSKPNIYCDTCYCDEPCQYYGDCCPGWKRTPAKVVHTACGSTTFPDIGNFITRVDDCPNEYQSTNLKKLCNQNSTDNWRFTQLVSDHTTGLVYKNNYCAQCNGVQNGDAWKANVVCGSGFPTFTDTSSKDQIFRDIMGESECVVRYIPPENFIPHECPSSEDYVTLSKCNQTGQWLRFDALTNKSCEELPYNPIKNYKNIFCYICNTYYPWSYIKYDYVPRDPTTIFSMALTSLFDLSDESPMASEVVSNDLTCPMLQDPYLCTCRDTRCANGKELKGGECVSVFEVTNLISYLICLDVEIRFNSNLVSSNDTLIIKDIIVNNTADLMGSHLSIIIRVRYISPCRESMIMTYEVESTVFFKEAVNIREFERRILTELPRWGQMNKDMNFTFSFRGTRINPKKNYILNSDLTIPCKEYNIPPIFKYLQSEKFVFFGSEIITFHKIYTCPSISLHNSEAVLSTDSKTLLIRANNRSLNDFEFKITTDGRYLVCVDDYAQQVFGAEAKPCPDVEIAKFISLPKRSISTLGLLSGICTSCSLVFLIVTFIVFCLLKKYRTSIGISIMMLTVTLFVAQTLFEFGAEQIEVKWVCETLGVLTHFFWLSTTFWMNVCTIILFYNLSYPIESRLTSTGKMMLYSILYTWGCPMMIVMVVILTSNLQFGNLGYGGSSCYITTSTCRRFGFALPVGLLVLLNIGLFSYTFIKLRRGTKLQSSQENQISMFACLKLSVITGLTWIFAFLYEATGYEAFIYLFTVFVGAQGFILFLVFACNKRIFVQLKMICTNTKTRSGNNNLRALESSSTVESKEETTKHSIVKTPATRGLPSLTEEQN